MIMVVLCVIRWGMMNLVGLMSLAQRSWKKDWLKLKSSFMRVNHRSIMLGLVPKPQEVFDRAPEQTPQILSNLHFLMSLFYLPAP